ncbi:D-glutamate cyclase family protein [Streptomyces cacaoi]|uniref:D-glutamate cyclase family protein n=1 Tax=Streptomyces cacaoi TaxID=1898 RepID=UPI0033306D1C
MSQPRAHLVAVPDSWAQDVSLFCARNSHACPVLDICDVGAWHTPLAPGTDLRTGLARYRVWRDGEPVAEPEDVAALWDERLVAFLIGPRTCTDTELAAAGVPLRHREQGRGPALFVTNRSSRPAGRLNGPLVVTMRPVPAPLLPLARAAGRGAAGHGGGPVHAGDPGMLGIATLSRPDSGTPVRPQPGDVPVFWPSPLTLQAALRTARPPFALTDAPGHPLTTGPPPAPRPAA